MNRMRVLGLAVLLLTVAAGCSDEKTRGEGLEATGEGGASRRFDATTTTVATGGGPATTSPPQTTTTAPPQTTTTAAPKAALEIKIQPDSANSKFEPSIGAVRGGDIVKWVNADNQPRSVEADGGVFRSPLIPPGGSWEWKAVVRGTINYKDGTRPYAVAQLRVQ